MTTISFQHVSFAVKQAEEASGNFRRRSGGRPRLPLWKEPAQAAGPGHSPSATWPPWPGESLLRTPCIPPSEGLCPPGIQTRSAPIHDLLPTCTCRAACCFPQIHSSQPLCYWGTEAPFIQEVCTPSKCSLLWVFSLSPLVLDRVSLCLTVTL